MQHLVVGRMHRSDSTSLLILCRSPKEVAAAMVGPSQPITQSTMTSVAGVGWKLRSLALLVCVYQVVQMVLDSIKDGFEIWQAQAMIFMIHDSYVLVPSRADLLESLVPMFSTVFRIGLLAETPQSRHAQKYCRKHSPAGAPPAAASYTSKILPMLVAYACKLATLSFIMSPTNACSKIS